MSPASSLPAVGSTAPDIDAEIVPGGRFRLSELDSDWCVLYFYPKDDTPGCTKEAQQFRQMFDQFAGANCRIIGVSKDSVESHQAFIKKYDLPFPLLSDPDNQVCTAYGVWGEKKNYGRTYMGITRSTFILAPNEGGGHRIAASWSSVRVPEHGNRVLHKLEEFQAEA